MALRILTVCTGNVCRSPLTEQLLRHRLLGSGVHVTSAGLDALVGAPMPALALEMARLLRVDDAELHRGRQLRVADVESADLVLGMDRDHRRRIAEMVPSASRRIFTLREFARVVGSVDSDAPFGRVLRSPDPGRVALDAALSHRGTQPRPQKMRDYDVVDPYGRPREVYERSLTEIVPAVTAIADYFAFEYEEH